MVHNWAIGFVFLFDNKTPRNEKVHKHNSSCVFQIALDVWNLFKPWRLLHLSIQKEDGRQRLRELLKWKKFDEERDLRPGILLDFVYESVVFAVKKGFPWHSVARVIKISQELLNDSKGTYITWQPDVGHILYPCLTGIWHHILSQFILHYNSTSFVLQT